MISRSFWISLVMKLQRLDTYRPPQMASDAVLAFNGKTFRRALEISGWEERTSEDIESRQHNHSSSAQRSELEKSMDSDLLRMISGALQKKHLGRALDLTSLISSVPYLQGAAQVFHHHDASESIISSVLSAVRERECAAEVQKERYEKEREESLRYIEEWISHAESRAVSAAEERARELLSSCELTSSVAVEQESVCSSYSPFISR